MQMLQRLTHALQKKQRMLSRNHMKKPCSQIGTPSFPDSSYTLSFLVFLDEYAMLYEFLCVLG